MKGPRDVPAGTQEGKPFEEADGVSLVIVGHVYDFQSPYWPVRYPDGDWEELNRQEVTSGVLNSRHAPVKGGRPLQATDGAQPGEAGGEIPSHALRQR